jgi:hypothetical protein
MSNPTTATKTYSCTFISAVERAGLSTLNEGDKVSYEKKKTEAK